MAVSNMWMRMLELVEQTLAEPKKMTAMRKEYPPGTCNAEDAWKEFYDEMEARRTELEVLAKELREKNPR